MFPKVSVIILTFNSSNTIKQCLDSILSQNYPEFEVLVIDNGSTDYTLELVKRYAASRENIRVFCIPDRPRGHLRNRGVEEAGSEIIAFLDSDVVLPYSGWLRDMVMTLIERPDVGIVSTSEIPCGSAINRYVTYRALFFEPRPNTMTSNNYVGLGVGWTVMRKGDIIRAGMFDDELSSGEDFDLTSRLIKVLGYKGVRLNTGVYHFKVSSFKEWLDRYSSGSRDQIEFLLGYIHAKPSTILKHLSRFVLGLTFVVPLVLALCFASAYKDVAWLYMPITEFVVALLIGGYLLSRRGLMNVVAFCAKYLSGWLMGK